jgi:hypothetical protein
MNMGYSEKLRRQLELKLDRAHPDDRAAVMSRALTVMTDRQIAMAIGIATRAFGPPTSESKGQQLARMQRDSDGKGGRYAPRREVARMIVPEVDKNGIYYVQVDNMLMLPSTCCPAP